MTDPGPAVPPTAGALVPGVALAIEAILVLILLGWWFDWFEGVTGLAVSNVILFISAIVAGVILYVTRRNTQAMTLLAVMEMVQDERMRKARRCL